MRIPNTFGWTMAFTLVASLAVAQDIADLGDSEREQALRGDLEHLHIANLNVKVLGKLATLEGTTESLFQKRQATAIAKSVPGIGEVFNDLQVVETEDAALEGAIREALGKDHHYTIYDEVTFSVARGRISLAGRLAPGGDPHAIEETVSKVRGVRAIENVVRVLPYSATDEKLREAVAIAVFDALGQERFADAGFHVVVENGRITLWGTVPDAAAASRAGEAARGTEGVVSVENLLTPSPAPGAF